MYETSGPKDPIYGLTSERIDPIKYAGIGEMNMDMVNHPPHYMSESGLETIDVIQGFTIDLNGIEAYDTGNILKYICRWKKKNGIEDLKKAQWYLTHLIKYLESLNE